MVHMSRMYLLYVSYRAEKMKCSLHTVYFNLEIRRSLESTLLNFLVGCFWGRCFFFIVDKDCSFLLGSTGIV